MKPPAIIGILLSAMLSAAIAEKDPFADSKVEEVRPERAIQRLPKAVYHRQVDSSGHEYTISGIYPGSANHPNLKDVASIYRGLIPDSIDLDLDFKARRATFKTSRKLTLSELAYAIDDMAKLGGDIPFWVELEARDIEATKDYAKIRYSVEPTDQKPPSELAGFWATKDKVLQIPLSLGGSELGCLMVVPTTSFCMCHSRFSLRVLDPDGKLIWKDEQTAYAAVKIALSNANEFGMHKIWLTRDDHGKASVFLINGSIIKK